MSQQEGERKVTKTTRMAIKISEAIKRRAHECERPPGRQESVYEQQQQRAKLFIHYFRKSTEFFTPSLGIFNLIRCEVSGKSFFHSRFMAQFITDFL